MRQHFIRAALCSAVVALVGCDDNDSTNVVIDTPEVTETGVFLDAAVGGIGYRTLNEAGDITREGVTNADGEYDYADGETVVFFIGGIELPPVQAQGVVTPVTIAQSIDTNAALDNPVVINVSRLLQTLDSDGDPSNGISIAEETTQAIETAGVVLDIDQLEEAPDTFTSSFETITTIDGIEDTFEIEIESLDIVSAEEAVSHLRAELEAAANDGVTVDIPVVQDAIELSGTISNAAAVTGQWEVFVNDTLVNDGSLDSGDVFFVQLSFNSGDDYEIRVSSSPENACIVTNGIAENVTSSVTDIEIDCPVVVPDTFSIGGSIDTVANVSGTWQLSIADVVVSSGSLIDGALTFTNQSVVDETAYVVSVTNVEGGSCSVENGAGTVSDANVTDVAITCEASPTTDPTPTFSVSGSVANDNSLVGEWVLHVNDVQVNTGALTAGATTFADATLLSGQSYAVSVINVAGGQCEVNNGSGTIAATDINDVTINCTADTVITPVYGISGTINNADSISGQWELFIDDVFHNDGGLTDGAAVFASETLTSGQMYALNVQPASGAECAVSNGEGQITDANITDIVIDCGFEVPRNVKIFEDNFESDSVDKWQVISLSSSNDWHTESFSGNYFAVGNCYQADEACDDWLITPELDLTQFVNVNISFTNAWNYGTDVYEQLKLLVSSDYDGSNPDTASWTDLSDSVNWSDGSFNFVDSGVVSFDEFVGGYAYIAFHHDSPETTGVPAKWEIDDVLIQGDATGDFPLDGEITAGDETFVDRVFNLSGLAINGAGAPYSYSWDFGDGTQANGESVSHTYGTAGVYQVLLTITDADSNTVTVEQYVSVAAATSFVLPEQTGDLRVASFNAGLDRFSEFGALAVALEGGADGQAKKVAEIIQRTDADILLLNEIDGNDDDAAVNVFKTQYLEVSQNDADAIVYPYVYTSDCNTGVNSGEDYNNNGSTDDPDDGYGFGNYPGQYCMAIFSKYEIDTANARTFQNFLWQDMPDFNEPELDGVSWYSAEELATFRLSSKTHIDLPINVDGTVIHILASHPTPPVFDGDEDRNGRRNYDEIRLWADYVDPEAGEYLYDDNGSAAVSLGETDRFVIMGDLNASNESDASDSLVVDGVSAMDQLLGSYYVNPNMSEDSLDFQVPISAGGAENDEGNIYGSTHTAVWQLRADYVLPSSYGLEAEQGGVFWPLATDNLYYLVEDTDDGAPSSSDHRLVWLDLTIFDGRVEDESKDPVDDGQPDTLFADDFSAGNLDAWDVVDLGDADNNWFWDEFNGLGFAKVSCFSGSEDCDDWLVQTVDLTDTNEPYLYFENANNYGTNPLDQISLLVSTNYNGDVETATWQDLSDEVTWSAGSWAFEGSTIDLTDYIGEAFTFAFYYSSVSGSDAGTWEIANVEVVDFSDNGDTVETQDLFIDDFSAGNLDAWDVVDLGDSDNNWFWDDFDGLGFAKVSCFNGSEDCDDWLVQTVDLTTANSPYLYFENANNYGTNPQDQISLLVSIDYDGDVETATWDDLSDLVAWSNGSWAFEGSVIDLTAYIGYEFTFAFQYSSVSGGDAGTWEIANVGVVDVISDSVDEPVDLFVDDFSSGNLDAWDVVDLGDSGENWYWDEFGGLGFAKISCFNASEACDDWLVQTVDLSSATAPYLYFENANNYGTDPQNQISLMVSTDYSGDVATATWEDLSDLVTWSEGSWEFVGSTIDLAAYIGYQFTFAFQYSSVAGSDAGTWEIANVVVVDAPSTDINVPAELFADDFSDGNLDLWEVVKAGSTGENWYWDEFNGVGFAKNSCYSASADCDDWLVQTVDLSTASTPSLYFENASNYGTDPLDQIALLISLDYSGDVSSATWQDISDQVTWSGGSWAWEASTIDLTSYVGSEISFAFHYSSVTGSDAATWEIANVALTDVQITVNEDVLFEDDFTSGTLDAWTLVDSGDASQNWYWDDFAGLGFAKISCFNGTEACDDWMLQTVDLSAVTSPFLYFENANNYGTDPQSQISLMVANDYSGDVSTATWVDLSDQVTWSAGSWAFEPSTVDLSAYVGGSLTFAFHYSAPFGGDAGTWEITNVELVSTSGTPTEETVDLFVDDFSAGNLELWGVAEPGSNDTGWYWDDYDGAGFAKISCYSNANTCDDWLIQTVDLSTALTPVLYFENTNNYGTDPQSQISLLVSVDYSGDTDAATWVDLSDQVTWSNGSWVWEESTVDLAAYVGSQLTFAFHYSSAVGSDAGTWEITNVYVIDTSGSDYEPVDGDYEPQRGGTVLEDVAPAFALNTVNEREYGSLGFTGVDSPATAEEQDVIVASDNVSVNGMSLDDFEYHTLLKSGQDVGGNTYGMMIDKAGDDIFVSNYPEFASILPVEDRIFAISQFESIPGGMYLTELDQAADGQLSPISTEAIDFSSLNGGYNHCAATVTPWNTHLAAEEFEPDYAARDEATGSIDFYYDNIADYHPDLSLAEVNPYWYGFPVEVAISLDGSTASATPVKHYAVGRMSIEVPYVMPDQKTLYLTDDGTNGGLFMFIAETEQDLSAGTLYAMKWNQVEGSNTDNAEMGAADLEWIELGYATSDEIKTLIDEGITFNDMFSRVEGSDNGECPLGYTSINFKGSHECLLLKPDMEIAASRLETRRFAAYEGATVEMRKEEGLTYNPHNHKMYMAISDLNRGMTAGASQDLGGPDHVQVDANQCGGIYEVELGYNDDIGSEFVMGHISGLFAGTPNGSGCDEDNIAGPDNVSYIGFDTLVITEDTSYHNNNFTWTYNLNDGTLTRILSAPYGAENTGPYMFNDINGFSYLTNVVQHPFGISADPVDGEEAELGYFIFPVSN